VQSCTPHSLTFDSVPSSSTSKHQKEDSPKKSGGLNDPSERIPQRAHPSTSNAQTPIEYSQYQALNNPSENNLHRGYSSKSYAQTPAEYSQYQTIYLSELPAPHSWPSENTIPSQEQMDYDLLGLSYQTPSSPPQYFAVVPEQNTGCPYHRTSLGLALEASRLGRGLSVMDRWMLEDESESGGMFAREDTGRISIDNGCSCALVEGSRDKMANWEES
jgi:hypothetical protein